VFNLQGSEIIVILLLALVVLGPEKLPDAVRKFTQTYNELKKMGNGFQSELRSVIDEPMREVRNTADMIRDAADPSKVDDASADRPGASDGDKPERATPTPPVVAPPPPFASSRSLGTPLPEPDGPPQPAPTPPRVGRDGVNGHAHETLPTPKVGDDVPAPPPPPST
jgi:sec-independent protein translocase protein TatB